MAKAILCALAVCLCLLCHYCGSRVKMCRHIKSGGDQSLETVDEVASDEGNTEAEDPATAKIVYSMCVGGRYLHVSFAQRLYCFERTGADGLYEEVRRHLFCCIAGVGNNLCSRVWPHMYRRATTALYLASVIYTCSTPLSAGVSSLSAEFVKK